MLSILMDLSEKDILIVGGGKVSVRKVKTFLKEKANIFVVSDNYDKSFEKFSGLITMIYDSYDSKYLDGKFLVVAATDKSDINEQVCIDAKERNILYNRVDKSTHNAVMFQSMMQRGDLMISVSTSGSFAGLSKNIKEELENYFPSDYGEYVNYLAKQRDVIKTSKSGNLRKEILDLLELTYNDYKKLENPKEIEKDKI